MNAELHREVKALLHELIARIPIEHQDDVLRYVHERSRAVPTRPADE